MNALNDRKKATKSVEAIVEVELSAQSPKSRNGRKKLKSKSGVGIKKKTADLGASPTTSDRGTKHVNYN